MTHQYKKNRYEQYKVCNKNNKNTTKNDGESGGELKERERERGGEKYKYVILVQFSLCISRESDQKHNKKNILHQKTMIDVNIQFVAFFERELEIPLLLDLSLFHIYVIY